MNLENDASHFLEPQKHLNNTHLNSTEASKNELQFEPPIQTGNNQVNDNDSVTVNNPTDEIAPEQSESDTEQHLVSLRVNEKRQAYSDIADVETMGEDTDEQPILLTLNDQVQSVEPIRETPSGLNKNIPAELDIDPETITDIAACKKIGGELINYGYYARAERVFYRAMELDPNDHEVRNYLGRIYMLKHEYDLARLYFKLAISLKPDYADAYNNLGKLFQSRGDMEGAWSYYKVAIKLNPGYARDKVY